MKRLRILLFLLVTTPCYSDGQKPMLYQQPTVSRTQIVFAYAEDLWVVSREGGEAKRLTSGGDLESTPVFSPDGTYIAFTAGNGVCVMRVTGGTPRRLTNHPNDWFVVAWTPDGKSVLFASARNSYAKFLRLFTVPAEGGFATEVPLPTAHHGTFSPDGTRIAYVPFRREHVWKQYRGGKATPIWIARLSDSQLIDKIPRDNSNDFNPMWVNDLIYFLSDRAGPTTLFAYDPAIKKVTQLIHNDGMDIKSASAGPDAIVYEQFGSLHLFDPKARKSRRVRISISADMPEVKPRFLNASKDITAAKLSPRGDRAVFEARGEIVTVTAENGEILNLTNSPGVRERFPAWSPDGKRIAYFSDESGEYELHIRNQEGTGEVKKIHLGGPSSVYFAPVWSPDSKKIAYNDARLNFWYVDVEKGQPVYIDRNTIQEMLPTQLEVPPPSWSPDSRWLSYAKLLKNFFRAIHIYSLESGKSWQVTDGLIDVRFPQFDRSGRYLFFAASKDLGPTLKGHRYTPSFNRTPTRSVYVALLRKDLSSPLSPRTSEAQTADKAPALVQIDLEDFERRIIALPVPDRNYTTLAAGEAGTLYLLEAPPTGSQPAGPGRTLYRFNLNTQQMHKVLEGIRHFELSQDGKKMLYRQERWAIVGTTALPNTGEGTLKMESLEVRVDPKAEWKQMYWEIWRIVRDFFYDPGFHGVDLKAVKKEYESYLESVASRTDPNYLFREMLSELRVSHVSASGGMMPRVKVPDVGLLGADYQTENGRYKFKRIYYGDLWEPEVRAPLREPGVNIKAGEYVLAVNGHEVHASHDIYQFFEGTTGKPVRLRVGPDPTGANAREVAVIPAADEFDLRYFAWVEENRLQVDKLTAERVAYVPVPDTLDWGYASFDRYYYAQAGKQALILDARFNSGGSLPDYLIAHLRRQLLSLGSRREGADTPAPYAAFFEPKVMLINEWNVSGGDALAYYFRKSGLGSLIGKRTFGGLVGSGGRLPLMDGGSVSIPICGIWSSDGDWVAENEGIAPDVDVEQDPAAVRAGHDPQLEKAVEMVLEALKKNPPPAIKRPPYKRLQ